LEENIGGRSAGWFGREPRIVKRINKIKVQRSKKRRANRELQVS